MQQKDFSFVEFFSHSSVKQSGNIWNSGGIVNIQITITKDMTEEQCWQMITQFNCPVTVRSTWNNVILVNEPREFISNILFTYTDIL